MRSVKVFLLAAIWLGFAAAVVLAHVAGLALGRAWRWKTISRLMCSFNRVIARLLNLKVEVEGSLDLPAQQGYLIASNHLGYIDGIVLAGLFPIIFVTKSEVRRWPLIGQWTALVGTICVERNRKNKIPIFVDETADKLKLGVNEIHSKLETAAYKNNSANRKQVSRTCRAIIAGEKAAANKMGGGGPVAHGMARGGR